MPALDLESLRLAFYPPSTVDVWRRFRAEQNVGNVASGIAIEVARTLCSVEPGSDTPLPAGYLETYIAANHAAYSGLRAAHLLAREVMSGEQI